MRFAITPRGMGKQPGARAIEDDGNLASGETFSVSEGEYSPDFVLDDDGLGLRQKTPTELGLETAAAAAAIVEDGEQAALAADARIDAVFEQLKTASAADISAFVGARFGTFTAPQRQVFKLLLQVAAITLRRTGANLPR